MLSQFMDRLTQKYLDVGFGVFKCLKDSQGQVLFLVAKFEL